MIQRLSAELHVARLLRMLVGVEAAIVQLESHDDDRERIIRRLRVVQNEIAAVLRRLETGR